MQGPLYMCVHNFRLRALTTKSPDEEEEPEAGLSVDSQGPNIEAGAALLHKWVDCIRYCAILLLHVLIFHVLYSVQTLTCKRYICNKG